MQRRPLRTVSAGQVALQGHLRAHRPQARVAVLLVAHLEIDEYLGHRQDEAAQAGQFLQLDVGAVDAEAFQGLAQVVEVLCRERFVEEQQLPELLHGFQGGYDLQHIGHKAHPVNPLNALRTQAVFQDEPPNHIKTNLLLKVIWIEHFLVSVFQKGGKST